MVRIGDDRGDGRLVLARCRHLLHLGFYGQSVSRAGSICEGDFNRGRQYKLATVAERYGGTFDLVAGNFVLPVVEIPAAPEPAKVFSAFNSASRGRNRTGKDASRPSRGCTCGRPSQNVPGRGSARAAAPCRKRP